MFDFACVAQLCEFAIVTVWRLYMYSAFFTKEVAALIHSRFHRHLAGTLAQHLYIQTIFNVLKCFLNVLKCGYLSAL